MASSSSDEELFITQDKFKGKKPDRYCNSCDDELALTRKEARIPEGTKTNTAWCVRTWSEWSDKRNKSNMVANAKFRHVQS